MKFANFFSICQRDRKFLRAEETESAHVQHYVALAAMANPAVAIEFLKDARTVWQLPAVNTPDRIAALRERIGRFPARTKNYCRSISRWNCQRSMAMRKRKARRRRRDLRFGVLWALLEFRARRGRTSMFFVNKRPVENRGINFALQEGYHTALMKGRYPVSCLFIEIDPGEVDVNIHPAKREIKFHREKMVRRIPRGSGAGNTAETSRADADRNAGSIARGCPEGDSSPVSI